MEKIAKRAKRMEFLARYTGSVVTVAVMNPPLAKRRKLDARAESSSSTPNSFSPVLALLREELFLEIAGFLPAEDLLRFPCTCKRLSRLDLEATWYQRCAERWHPWRNYRLTPHRLDKIQAHVDTCCLNWRQRYGFVEKEAHRQTLRPSDLTGLQWCLRLTRNLSLQDPVACEFDGTFLSVAGYAPMRYTILEGKPANSIPKPIDGKGDWKRTDWECCSQKQHFGVDGPRPLAIYRIASRWVLAHDGVVIVSRDAKGSGRTNGRTGIF